jgi:hypothetical protein
MQLFGCLGWGISTASAWGRPSGLLFQQGPGLKTAWPIFTLRHAAANPLVAVGPRSLLAADCGVKPVPLGVIGVGRVDRP